MKRDRALVSFAALPGEKLCITDLSIQIASSPGISIIPSLGPNQSLNSLLRNKLQRKTGAKPNSPPEEAARSIHNNG
jgi:hypothetical protein